MQNAPLRLTPPDPPSSEQVPRRPLGRHLVHSGKITNAQLVRALDRQNQVAAPLGEILMSDGLVTRDDITRAIAVQNGSYHIDLEEKAPDPDLAQLAARQIWLKHGCVPVQRLGNTVLVATSRPDHVAALRADLPARFPQILTLVASEQQIMQALARMFRTELTAAAETRVAADFSCRHWRPAHPATLVTTGLLVLTLTVALLLAPVVVLSFLSTFAVLCLFMITLLKLAGSLAHIGHKVHRILPPPDIPTDRWPRISVMVPLFKETEIADALVKRLQKIKYPKVLLDVILVLEEKDTLTRQTLDACDLPSWMRVVEVPDGGTLTTKPRALNYALDFCRGEIIGIWDAEDAPDPYQLHHVAAEFARADPDVACLQGILDYYNPRANWIARCFTIEYASWFRVVLPGLARLGLVIPLGGTTLFVRRQILHELGGWDAHNVTEDADLGMRIARFGYKTQFISTPTFEEANCRPWRWVKQRSRWLKGFMVTYAVHMRQPRRLLRELGWVRFLGVQAFFIGTLSQFVCAPLLWTYWIKLLGFSHPTDAVFGPQVIVTVISLFVATEVTNICVALLAVSQPQHRHLLPWTLTLAFYFPLGALASYKALFELIGKPFYWDKTQHGHSVPEPTSGNDPIA